MKTLVGQHIEQYRIEALIGSGGSGTVYRATDLNLVRPVALKLLKPGLTKTPARQKQIFKAAQSASRLSHPAIVPFYNFGRQNGHLYLVTAHVEGISLEKILALLARNQSVLRLNETLHIIAQVADGLGYAHQSGVLHGDLKPGNILIKPLERPLRSGDPPVKAMLADFGLSPIPDSGIPEGISPELARPLRRYLPYLSPERQAGQPVDGRADIYSLGAILYQLIAGVPYSPHATQRPPLHELRPGLPPDIARIATKALAYAPADRYQLAEQIGDDLRQAASRLTAADTLLFAPQAAVVDMSTLLSQDTEIETLEPAPQAEVAAAALPSPAPTPASLAQEEAPPALPPGADRRPNQEAVSTQEPSGAILQTSPPPAIGDQIVITGQGRAPRHFGMNKDVITIGRSPENDIVLSSLDVSRHHARLEKIAQGWQIVDAGSRGGTFCDGRKVQPQKPQVWQPGLRLQIGPHFLLWRLAEEVETNPAQITPAEPATELFQVSAGGSQMQASHSNFSVALTPTQATLAPGEQAHLQIDLFNQGSSVLVVKISLTGLPGIAALAQDTVSMSPGGRATVPLTLRLPALEQPLLAGQHPFQLLLRAEGPPVETAVLQGQLTILPEERLDLAIWPEYVEDGVPCRVMIRNDGNVISTLHLSAHDPAGKLRFFGDQQSLEVEPGGTASTVYHISQRQKRPLWGQVQQIPFEVEIRSNNGLRQNKVGHMEVRPRLPAWIMPIVQLLLVLLLVAVVLNSLLGQRRSPQETAPTPTVQVQVTTRSTSLTAAQLAGDDDGDGLTGEREIIIGSDPFNQDSDGDGLPDGVEINTYGTDPLRQDSDGDNLLDIAEVEQHNTDPTLADTDLDGITDGDEIAAGSDPLRHQAGGTAVIQSSPIPASPAAPSPLATPPPAEGAVTAAIPLLSTQSGWLTDKDQGFLSSGEAPRAGDLAEGTAVRALISYSLATIPAGALIRVANLRFSADAASEGDPFDVLGCLQIDAVELGQTVDNTAYDAPGFFISCEATSPTALDVAIDLEDAVLRGHTEFRLRLGFETESNGDTVANLYTLRTAPVLEVTYFLP